MGPKRNIESGGMRGREFTSTVYRYGRIAFGDKLAVSVPNAPTARTQADPAPAGPQSSARDMEAQKLRGLLNAATPPRAIMPPGMGVIRKRRTAKNAKKKKEKKKTKKAMMKKMKKTTKKKRKKKSALAPDRRQGPHR